MNLFSRKSLTRINGPCSLIIKSKGKRAPSRGETMSKIDDLMIYGFMALLMTVLILGVINIIGSMF